MAQPKLLILATGGTIAGQAGSATRSDYRPGQISIEAFLQEVKFLGLPYDLVRRQIANIGSEDINADIWRELHEQISDAFDDPAIDGIIITHGTDTAEETAFLLDQTLPTSKPVVIVGAMRPADAVGSDGLHNFANAMQVASSSQAIGCGVLVAMSDQIFAARDLRKARTNGTNAFAGFPRGPIALASPDSLDWLASPWRIGEPARHGLPNAYPKVPILHIYAGMDASVVELLCKDGAKAIIIAGFGTGNMPDTVRNALINAAREGLIIVRSSRVDEGLVDREPQDDANCFIAARALGPAKSRILLQLLLAEGTSNLAEIQAAFDRR